MLLPLLGCSRQLDLTVSVVLSVVVVAVAAVVVVLFAVVAVVAVVVAVAVVVLLSVVAVEAVVAGGRETVVVSVMEQWRGVTVEKRVILGRVWGRGQDCSLEMTGNSLLAHPHLDMEINKYYLIHCQSFIKFDSDTLVVCSVPVFTI